MKLASRDTTRKEDLTQDHSRVRIGREACPLKEAGAAERDQGVGQVLEDGSGRSLEVDELGGEVALRPVDAGRGLGRDVNLGSGFAVDVDAAAVTVDEPVAELLDEDERHAGQVLVQVDRAVDVQRRLLVLTLDPCRSGVAGKSEPELADLARGADRQPAFEGPVEGG